MLRPPRDLVISLRRSRRLSLSRCRNRLEFDLAGTVITFRFPYDNSIIVPEIHFTDPAPHAVKI